MSCGNSLTRGRGRPPTLIEGHTRAEAESVLRNFYNRSPFMEARRQTTRSWRSSESTSPICGRTHGRPSDGRTRSEDFPSLLVMQWHPACASTFGYSEPFAAPLRFCQRRRCAAAILARVAALNTRFFLRPSARAPCAPSLPEAASVLRPLPAS
jgi:hypothetical protein